MVFRYDMDGSNYSGFAMEKRADGDYVRCDDYEALVSTLDALRVVAKEWMADDTLGANYEAINRMCEILFPDEATP